MDEIMDWNSLPWKPRPIGFARTTDIEMYTMVFEVRPVDESHQIALFTRDQLLHAVAKALQLQKRGS